jgi:hypothetical protein
LFILVLAINTHFLPIQVHWLAFVMEAHCFLCGKDWIVIRNVDGF